ncbi:2-dehydropantoate 2-reductase [Eisenibacter elegans]|jgi:2-dehydropantoate 2-reductase|uniref:2-dehydropantoate 2-reductase n=1 Tax=Eisenibacter elegans TaxID=997 RepID=UPI00040E2457|nr:2-dehydropantoate 2-reductase [Eisenibacter elegans]
MITPDFLRKPIGLMGAGSIGCYIGAHLVRIGLDSVWVGRAGLQEAILTEGLRITDYKGADWHLNGSSVPFHTDPKALAACGAVLVCVKSTDTETVGKALATVLAEGTLVVSLQNGIRNKAILQAQLPQAKVLAGMVPFNVAQLHTNHWHRGTSGAILLEEGSEASALTALLHASGIEAATHPLLPEVQWGKLVFNLNNALNALAGIPLREELSERAFRLLVAAMMREALLVMQKAGIKPRRLGTMIPSIAPCVLALPDFLFFKVAAKMVRIDPQARSSMSEDLAKGRLTEIDFLNGEIVALGQEVGVPTPLNETICQLIKAAEQAKEGSPRYTATQLQHLLYPERFINA